MTTTYSDILKKIKEAVREAVSTPNRPEATFRERVAPLVDDYIRSKRINLSFQAQYNGNLLMVGLLFDGTHKKLARLSKQCHEKVAAGISETDLEEQIDELAAELLELTKEELKDIKESLEETR